MRRRGLAAVLLCIASLCAAQNTVSGPSNEKAQKTYKQAFEYLRKYMIGAAVDGFKKADKQDGGHCLACQENAMKYALQLRDWKTAEGAAQEVISEAQNDGDAALAHYELGVVLLREGMAKHKQDLFSRAHAEFTTALNKHSNFPAALFADGQALAYLLQDNAAKAQFQKYVKMNSTDDLDRRRALRFINEPELARARMAPPFELITSDGQKISLDDLKGKVVLLDFWATWCGPCRETIPHIRQIANKFQGQPLVVLSVSVDEDEEKWKAFVAKNEMTWPQYRDAGTKGQIATLFGVEEIPHTFTIDSDGVLQDEHIGDSSVEGKLKKLLAQAEKAELANKSQ